MKTLSTPLLAVALLVALALPGAASARDRDRDRMPDRWEKRYGLSTKVNQARRDRDRDDLTNLGEYRSRTNPRDPDTDNDGIEDGDEHAGVVLSYREGVLRIELNSGGILEGHVTGVTDFACRGEKDGEEEPDREYEEEPGYGGPDARAAHGYEEEPREDCTDDDLREGVRIHEALVRYTAEGPVFKLVVIVR